MSDTTAQAQGSGTGPISEAEAEEHVSGICFKHGPPRRVGIELEWLVHDAADPARPVAPQRLAAAFAGAQEQPMSGQLSLEPGGQWELSSQPADSLAECLAVADRDLGRMAAAAAAAGLRLAGLGAEPDLPPRRTLDQPRYAAMEEYFDRRGHWGRVMMCSTASVQVNLDAGLDGDLLDRPAADPAAYPGAGFAPGPDSARQAPHGPAGRPGEQLPDGLAPGRERGPDPARQTPHGAAGSGERELRNLPHGLDPGREPGPDPARQAPYRPANPLGQRERWDLLHDLGPVLVAAFANSPLLNGRPTGWRSTRQAVWARLDPGRTLAPLPHRAAGTGADGAGTRGLRTAWTDYVLNAELMCVRRPHGPWTAPRGLTFRDWLRSTGPDRPTQADLDYHLSTLFPPVRPRGHFELRVVDAQQGGAWQVVAALVTALLDDPVAADAARAVVEPLCAPQSASTVAGRAAGAGERGPRGALWLRAARLGPADPALRTAAEECFDLALAALPRLGAPAWAADAVADYAERYVRRGRCPADDRLDALSDQARRPEPRRAEEISWS
jgi:gamma-glutamylcysteine synthetase